MDVATKRWVLPSVLVLAAAACGSESSGGDTAANLVEHVLPPAPLRQWVLTFPFPWRKRLGYDAKLLGALTRVFVTEVLAFYTRRMAEEGVAAGQSGAVVVIQRTSSDLKLNPHLHVVFLDGVYRAQREHLLFHELPHLRSRDVAEALTRATVRMAKYLRRRSLLEETDDEALDGLAALAASAASGRTPPAGPEWRRGALPRTGAPLSFDKPLCVALDGFTLHAATRAGALDAHGREALLKYVLRPPIAQERVVRGPDGLVRIALKRASPRLRSPPHRRETALRSKGALTQEGRSFACWIRRANPELGASPTGRPPSTWIRCRC